MDNYLLNKISKYDFNVYGKSTNVVTLTAYAQYYDLHEGYIVTNYENGYITAEFKYPRNYAEIQYLLDKENLDELLEEWSTDEHTPGFTDYDEWPAPEFLLEGNVPRAIMDFLEMLPDYELKLPHTAEEEA